MKRKLAHTKVAVTVMLNVTREDFEEPKLSIKDIRAAAVEAVEECVKHGESRGFNHGLSNIVSIGVERVEIATNLSRLL
jgi:7-cyano-7-deazaguanine synthase in queuosine biosynthesis